MRGEQFKALSGSQVNMMRASRPPSVHRKSLIRMAYVAWLSFWSPGQIDAREQGC